VNVGATVEEQLRRVQSGTDVLAAVLTTHRLGTCPTCAGLFTLVKTAAGRQPFSAHVARCTAPPVMAAAFAAGNAPTVCPVAGCAGRGKAAHDKAPLALHLARCHLFAEVPPATVRDVKLAPCPRCAQPYRSRKPRSGSTPLAVHVRKCKAGDSMPEVAAAPPPPSVPPRQAAGASASAAAAAAVRTAPTVGPAPPRPFTPLRTPTPPSTTPPPPAPPPPPTPPSPASAAPPDPDAPPSPLITADYGEWARRRSNFLHAAAPAGADWAPLVAPWARTLGTVPRVLVQGWGALGGDMLRWVLRAPDRPHAWLWLLLLSLLFHFPARGVGRAPGPKPLSRAARLSALLDGRFADALADRDAGVWRRPPGCRAPEHDAVAADVSTTGDGQVAMAGPLPSMRQRRALRRLAHGQLRGCVQTLTGQPVAAETDAVRHKTSTLFPATTPDLATAESLAAAFPDQLAAAKVFGDARAGTAPRQLVAETVGAVIRSAARGKAPGPSGLRSEHIWALSSAGRDALVRVVQLLASGDGVDKVPPVARRALGAATLLLLVKPGGVDAAGVPGLRPIGMTETIRKLVGKALMREVLPDARRYFLPLQRAVGVSGACEDLVHKADARLAVEPTWGALQLDFKNAFNRISIQAAMAVAQAAFPELVPHLRCIYLGEPPPVYGWGVDDGDEGLPARLVWRVERGTQQGDVLGSLIQALALHPALQAIAARHERCTVLGLHDDVSVIGPVDELAAVLRSASELGAKVDAELAPAKCAAWSPTPRAPPSDLATQRRTDGLTYSGIPAGGDVFFTAEVDKMAAAHDEVVRAVASFPPGAVQAQLLQLRMCASPLTTYTLRCLPPAAAKVLAARVDATVRRELLRLLGA